MSELVMLELALLLLGINLSILVASSIIGTAINNLAKVIKEELEHE